MSGPIEHGVAETARFRSWAATHVGTVRKTNQDAYVNRPDLGLWAVADGAGGHDGGEIAAGSVVSALETVDPSLSAAEILVEVRDRLEAVHARLRAVGASAGESHLCASTVVVLLVRDDHFACLWAGDSRAYLCRGGALTRLTRDHSLVEELLDDGAITAAEAEHHPHANVITRAVGADSDTLELDKRTGRLESADKVLLCSDGLCKTLPDQAIAALLADDEDAAAERLVLAALTAQATDNVTAVTIEAMPDARAGPAP